MTAAHGEGLAYLNDATCGRSRWCGCRGFGTCAPLGPRPPGWSTPPCRRARMRAWSPTPRRDQAGPARGDHRGELRPDRGVPRPRGAGRVRHRTPLDLRRARPRRRRARARPDRRRASPRATGSASGRRTAPSGRSSQYATAKVGAILVNVNPAYRTHEFSYAVNQSGLRMLISAAELQDQRLPRRWSRRPRRRTRRLERVVYIGTDDWADAARRRRGAARRRASPSGWRRSSRATRSTSSTPRAPPATPRARRCRHRNILNNGFFVTETDQLHRAGPAVHPGALLPLLRHGDGQPRLHHATAPRW